MRNARVGPRYTPLELARLLHLPPPTDEQAAIIAHPVKPLLVVAGAGSGKTETMASRVVWLVANGYAHPGEILGLTFTRKAAGELAHRVRARLSQLVRSLGGRDEALAGEATISTYHSYAARVVTEHGLRGGFEPSARLLTEAARWQIVDSLVRAYTGEMTGLNRAPGTVTDDVLALSAELAEHLLTPDDLAAWTGRFFAELQSFPGRMYKDVSESLRRQQNRLTLLPLVRLYEQRKLGIEAMDFGDQMARAALVARDHPEVGRVERGRFRVVLLDEYQDTSHAQVVMLNNLFGGGHPVTAVGDPCQSIYGWRGASAGTLERFPDEFPDAEGHPAWVRSLTRSWRNRPEILKVANVVSAPLRAQVGVLKPAERVAESVGGRTVSCALLPSYAEEASWIADSMLTAWRLVAGMPKALPEEIPLERRPTSAVLVRVRSQIPVIEEALRARGLPVEVVGLGGLLDTPEVRDVVCTLRVLADPTDGASLLRLLTGARWRIGPRDLVALHRRARTIAGARAPKPEDPESEAPAEVTADRLDDATLIEAMADLGAPAQYAPDGYARLAAFSRELGALRQRLDQPLPDLLADIERTIGLDVEVAVRGWAAGDAGLARAHLDTLGEAATRFGSENESGTIAGFLAFLTAAEEEERGLEPGQVDVVEGAVQILTAHAAKGLEWDVVSAAGLCRGVWPGLVRGSDHYLGGIGVLPFPLRGDASGLPVLDLEDATDQKDVAGALSDFARAWREHDEREERRLAYVAVTRPRRLLLCSGYWWGDGVKRPRGPSVFLDEIRATCEAGAGVVAVWTPEPAPGETNPSEEVVATAEWPSDPLGLRRPAMAAAADLIRRMVADPDASAAEAFADLAAAHPEVAARAGLAADLVGLAGPGWSVGVAADPGDTPEDQPGPHAGALAADASSDRPFPVRPEPSETAPAATGPADPVHPGAAPALDRASLLAAASAVDRVAAEVDPDIARWRREARLLLAERAERAHRDGPIEVALPPHLSVSQLVVLRRDPQALARSLRRPLPQRPAPHARRGTAFHVWLEQRFGAGRLIDIDELPGAADEHAAGDEELLALQEAFLTGEWADRTPLDVEVPFATTVAGVVVRGRMDAVFADPDGRFDVIDWKTGRRPTGAEAEAAAVQLSAYRIAWATLAGVPITRVRAGFHYVREQVTVRPADLMDVSALAALITEIPEESL
ncbi:UvrD-helicase domain-containing protein [Actinoplanes awajinensis]|uniref:DNA 3'-5' helicase n=1 Tax=Actinoplanes awajinensis subsp. mycoplanecinus TaxID=135947 RepID=A0A117MPR8_9ACTN|nr:UvrD-helicase domain-containing protein [Actinoplanes awajinensis]KUL29067.1 DNA helicase UvrD [Actinoplanes awajinensis subsp. mycoplanecinus]